MSLQEQIKYLESQIEEHKEMLNISEKKYKALMSATQPTAKELYNGIEKYFDLKISEGNYEHILGGDGRGMPWSEPRKGKIAKVKIKDEFYLDEEQIELVKNYVTKVHEPDVCEIDFK